MKRGRRPQPGPLTQRERQVLALLQEGLTNREIAARLGISLDGAKYHVSEILARLGLSSREEAVQWQERHRALFFLLWLHLRMPPVPRLTMWSAAIAGGIAALALFILILGGLHVPERSLRETALVDERQPEVPRHPTVLTLSPDGLGLGCTLVELSGMDFSPNAPVTISGVPVPSPRAEGYGSFSMGPLTRTDQDGSFHLSLNLGGMVPPGTWQIFAATSGAAYTQATAWLRIEPQNDCPPIRT